MWILQLYQNEIPAEVFSCKICKIFRITFLSNNSGQLLTVLLTFRERVPRDSLSRNFIKFAIKLSPPSQTIVIRNGNDYAQTHNPYFNSNFITTTLIFFLHKKDINFGIKYHIMLTPTGGVLWKEMFWKQGYTVKLFFRSIPWNAASGAFHETWNTSPLVSKFHCVSFSSCLQRNLKFNSNNSTCYS